jgi:hypothetical protein
LIGSINCRIWVHNFREGSYPIYVFNLAEYRVKELGLNPKTAGTNMMYFMAPYSNFDVFQNPLIYVMDRYGTALVNLASKEVITLQMYPDQIHNKGI